jgi:integrase
MKKFKPTHLELRYRTYFAVLYIPKDVQVSLGKSKFFETTGTGDLKVAQSIASMKVIKWKAEIANARSKSDDPVINSASELNRLIKNNISPKNMVLDVIDEEEQRIREEHGDLHADTFKSVAAGKSKVLKEYLTTWKKYQQDRGLSEKNIDQMSVDIEILTSFIPTTNLLTLDKTTAMVRHIASKGNLTASSVNRIVKSNRNFYKYLQAIEVVPEHTTPPFIVPNEFKISKRPNSKSINKVGTWVNFEDEEVVNLYQEAKARDESTLADLIKIAAYTGARIEEICSLKKEQVKLQKNSIEIINAKTDAGNRVIPIHKELKKEIKRLIDNEDDEYLLPNLTFNKYKDRSNAIGKKFGRLKKTLGYSSRHVFHSIRKTVTTQLENANLPQNITADILGHEKQGFTYRQYSGGATFKVKQDALAYLKYNFNKKVESPLERATSSKTRTKPTRKTVTNTIKTKKSVTKKV